MKNDPLILAYHALFESGDMILMVRGLIIWFSILFLFAALGYIVYSKFTITVRQRVNKLLFSLWLLWGASGIMFLFFAWYASGAFDVFLWLSFSLGYHISWDSH